jgi:hypothetical protein
LAHTQSDSGLFKLHLSFEPVYHNRLCGSLRPNQLHAEEKKKRKKKKKKNKKEKKGKIKPRLGGMEGRHGEAREI